MAKVGKQSFIIKRCEKTNIKVFIDVFKNIENSRVQWPIINNYRQESQQQELDDAVHGQSKTMNWLYLICEQA